jgi:hypothetical protein
VLPDRTQVPLFEAEDETYVEFEGRVLVNTVLVPWELLAL